MPKILINNISCYYEIKGDGFPLILISGLGGDHCSVWPETTVEKFSKKYKTILFDNRGIGQTDIPDSPYSIEMMADDVAALMDALNISQAHIAGYSMGGQIAYTFAQKYPAKVGKLVICVSFRQINTHSRLFLDEILKLWGNGAATQTISNLISPWLSSDNFLDQHYNESSEEQDRFPQPFHGFKRQYEALCQSNLTPNTFTNDEINTLFIAGGIDRLCPVSDVEKFSQMVTGSIFMVFPDSGHLVSLEEPEKFATTLLEFFASESE